MVRRHFIWLSLLAVAIASPVTLAEENASGISGRTLLGPACPVQRIGNDNCKDRPYKATMVVKTANQTQGITQFTSDSDGRFRVALPPGHYQLEQISKDMPFPRAKPQEVTVEPHAFTPVDILFDSGIRR